MPTHLTHVLDEATHEDGVRLLSLLLASIPRDRVEQRVIVIGRTPAMLTVPTNVEVSRIGRRFSWPIAWRPELDRLLAGNRPDAVYAWGTAATIVLAGHYDRHPVSTVICEPADAGSYSRWWRGAAGRDGVIEVLCASDMVQRRLLESGVPTEATAVIRPGVDLEAIRRAQQTGRRAGPSSRGTGPASRRAEIGLPPEARVLLTASPPSRTGGHYYAVWAAAILRQIWPDLRMVVPGTSREQNRLRRLIERMYCPEMYHLTGDRYTPAELLAVSDMLILPAVDDVPIGWLAWAMATSVPIVASAVPSATELITDRHNGFLSKPAEPHTLAIHIRAAAESGDTLRQCVETARSHAFELFSTQRCVDEHLKAIDKLAAGRRVLAGAQDATIDT